MRCLGSLGAGCSWATRMTQAGQDEGARASPAEATELVTKARPSHLQVSAPFRPVQVCDRRGHRWNPRAPSCVATPQAFAAQTQEVS